MNISFISPIIIPLISPLSIIFYHLTSRFWVVHIPGAGGASGVGATCGRSRRGPEDHVTRGSGWELKDDKNYRKWWFNDGDYI
jgi:hypothetical protein